MEAEWISVEVMVVRQLTVVPKTSKVRALGGLVRMVDLGLAILGIYWFDWV